MRAAILTALALVLHVGVPALPGTDAPACQVHVWDGNPPYDCHSPAAEGDDA
jgi:hypothetical protein